MKAPVVVFAYNRPDHLLKTLEALSKNTFARESEIYIYIDGPKNESGIKKNHEVYEVARSFQENYFSSVTIRHSKENHGLAASIIKGVTEIINQFGRVIVLEDDSLPNCNYLAFMNQALDFYQDDTQIFSIGGYTVPLTVPQDYNKDIILTQRSSSYAWATWKNRWDKIDWEIRDYRKFRWDFRGRRKFNYWGEDRASMLDDQINGRISSWAIRFDYAMCKQKMYNILPRFSLIQNIGHDGSGTHNRLNGCGKDIFHVDISQTESTFTFEKVGINEEIRQSFCAFFRVSKRALCKRFISNLLYRKRK